MPNSDVFADKVSVCDKTLRKRLEILEEVKLIQRNREYNNTNWKEISFINPYEGGIDIPKEPENVKFNIESKEETAKNIY